MKKGILFLALFLLILTGVYLFEKSRQLSINLSSLNQKNTPVVLENEEKSTVEEVNQGLTLEIDQPKDKTKVNSSNIIVSGRTSPGADVFINDKELKANHQGKFSTNINLDEGENIITIVASDSQGNYAEKELVITLETIN